MKPMALIAGLALATAISAASPQTALADEAAETAGRIADDVRRLASPTFAGRSIGTPYANAAAGYLAGRLMQIGAEPLAGHSFLSPVPVRAALAEGARGALSAGDFEAVLGETLALSVGASWPTDLSAPLTLIRWSDATTALPADFDPAQFAGHILISEQLGEPGAATDPAIGAALAAISNAKPAAVLSSVPGLSALLREMAVQEDGASPTWSYAQDADRPAGRGGQIDAGIIAQLFASAPVADELTTLEIETLGSPARLTLAFERLTVEHLTEHNVMALVPGTSGAGKAVLLTAHYDHLGTVGETIYPGADDNASGVAVLLEVAARLRERPAAHDVHIVFFTGEEHGLIGSRSFAAAPPVPLERYAGLINIDAIGRPLFDQPAYAQTVFASGLGCWPAIDRAIEAGRNASGLTVTELADEPALAMLDASCEAIKTATGGAPSDQFVIVAEGVPGILLTGGLNADYHQPTDTADKVDFDRLSAVADLIEGAVRGFE